MYKFTDLDDATLSALFTDLESTYFAQQADLGLTDAVDNIHLILATNASDKSNMVQVFYL